MERVAGEHIGADQRDLPGRYDHAAGGEPRKDAIKQGFAVERAGEQPQAKHEESEGLDLRNMLDAPNGGPAEGGGEGGDGGPCRMPAAILEDHEHGDGHDPEEQETIQVQFAETRRGVEIRQQESGRKDQRLRVGDLRRAGKDVVCPEWGFARVQSVRQELQLRLEMRLGVIGYRDRPGQPRPREEQPAYRDRAESHSVTARTFHLHILLFPEIVAVSGKLFSQS